MHSRVICVNIQILSHPRVRLRHMCLEVFPRRHYDSVRIGLPPIYGPSGVRGFSVVCCSISGSSPVPQRREAVGRLELRYWAAKSAGVM